MTLMYTNVSGEKGELSTFKIEWIHRNLAPSSHAILSCTWRFFDLCVCVFLSFKLDLFQPNPNEFILIFQLEIESGYIIKIGQEVRSYLPSIYLPLLFYVNNINKVQNTTRHFNKYCAQWRTNVFIKTKTQK